MTTLARKCAVAAGAVAAFGVGIFSSVPTTDL